MVQSGRQPQMSSTKLPIIVSPLSVSSTSGWNWNP